MSARARIGAIALASVSVLVLGGCVPGEPTPTASPEPSATPVFASEEEALAAATDAYAAYLAASDQILADGGENQDRISSHVTPAYEEGERVTFDDFAQMGFHSEGESKFDSTQVQQFQPGMGVGDTMTIYLCYDATDVRVLDGSGNDVTPANRPNRVPLEVDLQLIRQNPPELLVGRSDGWSGNDFC